MADEVTTQVETETTPVETPPAEVPVESTEETTPVVDAAPTPPVPTELETKLKAAEREAERHRKRADYAFAQMDALAKQQQALTPPPDPEPTQDTFPDQLSFALAHSKWESKQAVHTGLKQYTEQQQKTLADLQQEMAVREHLQKIAEIEQRDPTFAQAKTSVGQLIDNGNGQVAPYAMALYQELFDSPQYEGLVRHFAANPQEAQRLMGLPARQVTKEIAYLETQLKAGSLKPAPAATAFRQTQAPAPASRPNGSQASATAIDLNDPTVPIDVWKKEHDRREKMKRIGRY